MKKILVSVIVFIITLSFCTSVFADEKVTVGSEDINTKQGETFFVPIEINGNSGIMGFKITVKYPDKQLVLKDITSGAVTKSGLFNTSISDFNSVHGSFDILWSTTENVKTDGTLFILKFEVPELASNGNYNISLSYSQEDTFDEDFNDLQLSCSPVKVTVNDGTMVESTTEEKTSDDQTNETSKNNQANDNKISDDYLISSVDSVKDSFSSTDLSEADKQSIVNLTNNLLVSYDENANQFNSYDELLSSYNEALKNQSVKEIIESTDGDVIISVTNEVLDEYNAKTFSDIPEDKQQEAVEKVKEKLVENNSEMKTFDKIDNNSLAVETLDELVDKTNEQENENAVPTESITANDTNTKQILLVSAIAVCMVVLVVTIFLVIKKRRKTK